MCCKLWDVGPVNDEVNSLSEKIAHSNNHIQYCSTKQHHTVKEKFKSSDECPELNNESSDKLSSKGGNNHKAEQNAVPSKNQHALEHQKSGQKDSNSVCDRDKQEISLSDKECHAHVNKLKPDLNDNSSPPIGDKSTGCASQKPPHIQCENTHITDTHNPSQENHLTTKSCDSQYSDSKLSSRYPRPQEFQAVSWTTSVTKICTKFLKECDESVFHVTIKVNLRCLKPHLCERLVL